MKCSKLARLLRSETRSLCLHLWRGADVGARSERKGRRVSSARVAPQAPLEGRHGQAMRRMSCPSIHPSLPTHLGRMSACFRI